MIKAVTKPKRCPWPGIADADYIQYHDTEWGVPMTDDIRLFEKLVLEGFQAGLSWLTILKKRENFRKAFHDFDADRIARFGSRDIARLMANDGIIRNRLKIEATIANAKAFQTLQKEMPFADFLWGFSEGFPKTNRFHKLADVPAATPVSEALAKALKARGFRFVGPTTVYAFMQSTGFVNDHLVTCPRHRPCAKLQKQLSKVPTASTSSKT